MRQCWNWQTGTFEGRVSLTYGFKSRLPHQVRMLANPLFTRVCEFFVLCRFCVWVLFGCYCDKNLRSRLKSLLFFSWSVIPPYVSSPPWGYPPQLRELVPLCLERRLRICQGWCLPASVRERFELSWRQRPSLWAGLRLSVWTNEDWPLASRIAHRSLSAKWMALLRAFGVRPKWWKACSCCAICPSFKRCESCSFLNCFTVNITPLGRVKALTDLRLFGSVS